MYPISVVAQKTGLTPEVLRAWERRYNGVRPTRDGSGRRVYSRALLDRLVLISRLLRAGYRVGDIVELSAAKLTDMLEELGPAGQVVPTGPEGRAPALGTPQPMQVIRERDLVEDAVAAVMALDTGGLRRAADAALTAQGRLDLADRFVFPVMRRVKDRVTDGDGSAVHVAFARAQLRILVSGFLLGISSYPTQGRRVVIATPEGHPSDLGALASAVHAAAVGWDPLILGSDIPSDAIVAAATDVRAHAVLLTCVTHQYDMAVYRAFSAVREHLPATVPVYFGGRLPETLVRDLADAGLSPLDNMDHLRTALEREAALQN